MPQLGRGLRTGMLLVAGALLLSACEDAARREAETAAAPVRRVVERLAARPNWGKKPPKCLCVGLFQGDAVADFPSGVLDDELTRHRWVRNWSECAPMYGRKSGLADCRGGMADYICTVVERADLPAGTSRVECRVNGENELLLDEYDVVRNDRGFDVRSVSLKASAKLNER